MSQVPEDLSKLTLEQLRALSRDEQISSDDRLIVTDELASRLGEEQLPEERSFLLEGQSGIVHKLKEELGAGSVDVELVLDFNGDEAISAAQIAFGFIEEWERLQLPQAVMNVLKRNPTIQGRQEQLKRLPNYVWQQFIVENYEQIGNNIISEGEKLFLIALRLTLVNQGFLYPSVGDRCVYVDEVDVRNDKKDLRNLPSGFVGMLAHVKKSIVAVVGTVTHAFRVRGHHYRDDLIVLYNRIWQSCLVEMPQGVALPSWKHIARTGLHAFGVKALEDFVQFHHDKGHLPGALEIRRDAAPAGCAIVSSAAAVIRTMQSEPYWGVFQRLARDLIEPILDLDKQIRSDPLSYHQLSTLYGRQRPVFNANIGSVLAPILQGFVDSLSANSPLKGVKALEKASNNNAARRETFASLMERSREREAEMDDVGEFFERYFTHIRALPAT